MKALAVALITGLFYENAGHCEKVELFVSPAGNDADAGTKSKPFKTLDKARDTVRKIKNNREVVVWLNGGVYDRERPFELTAED